MTTAQTSQDSSIINDHYRRQEASETAVSALQQVGELMRSLMSSRMSGEELVSLEAPQVRAMGIRSDTTSNLLCTAPSGQCPFHIPPALTDQLKKEQEDVLQVLLVLETEGNPFVSVADPPISTTLAAMEFATPQGPIAVANLTPDSAIQVTLHQRDVETTAGVNITLPPRGSVNFTVRPVETDPHARLFIALNFSITEGGVLIVSSPVTLF